MCPTDQGIARNSHLERQVAGIAKGERTKTLTHEKSSVTLENRIAPCQAFAICPWPVVNCQFDTRRCGSQPKPGTTVRVGWVEPTNILAWLSVLGSLYEHQLTQSGPVFKSVKSCGITSYPVGNSADPYYVLSYRLPTAVFSGLVAPDRGGPANRSKPA